MTQQALIIRDAQIKDAEALLAIYAPIVTKTAISFELEPPSLEDFCHKIVTIQRSHCWLVAETPAGLGGYVYGSTHRPRGAYRFSVEVTAYTHEAYRGQGLGTKLYLELFERLKTLGFESAYAGIALPNRASIALHTKVGFKSIGVFPRVGFKFDRWHDVAWYYRPLQDKV